MITRKTKYTKLPVIWKYQQKLRGWGETVSIVSYGYLEDKAHQITPNMKVSTEVQRMGRKPRAIILSEYQQVVTAHFVGDNLFNHMHNQKFKS